MALLALVYNLCTAASTLDVWILNLPWICGFLICGGCVDFTDCRGWAICAQLLPRWMCGFSICVGRVDFKSALGAWISLTAPTVSGGANKHKTCGFCVAPFLHDMRGFSLVVSGKNYVIIVHCPFSNLRCLCSFTQEWVDSQRQDSIYTVRI